MLHWFCQLIQPLALFPGLLTTAFVACSTIAGEGLVLLVTCSDVHGRVEEWHIPSVQLWDSSLDLTRTAWCRLLSGHGCDHRALAYKECASPPHIHPTSMDVTACARDEFYQALPHVSNASENTGVRSLGMRLTYKQSLAEIATD